MMPAILALRRVIVRQAIPFVGVVTPHCPRQVWEGSYAGHSVHGCDPPADAEFTVITLAARSAPGTQCDDAYTIQASGI